MDIIQRFAIPSITKVNTNDLALSKTQDSLDGLVGALKQHQVLNGIIIKFDFVTGSNTIPHGLGRKPLGYILIDQSNYLSLYSEANNPDITKFLKLQASASCSGTLFIF